MKVDGVVGVRRISLQKGLGFLVLGLGVFLLSIPLCAQTNTGTILGTVFDPSGAVVPNATVTILDVDRGASRTLTTNEAGEYAAPNLLPGKYTVRAFAPGFKTIDRPDIGLEVASEVRIDVTLQPGEQTQTITVTEEIPLVNTTSATLGGTISNLLIGDLPVQGRNFQKLLELRPGVYIAPGSGKWTQSSNGMRREHNVYILNGIDTIEGFSSQSVVNATPVFGDATSIVPIDAIQEFNTQQSPKAEYGWKPGAIVNVGLRSGTNSLHGSAYAFGRDDALDAKNPFILAGNPKQPTAIEDFGGVIGGPIRKDKLFFLLGYEGQRNTIGSPSSSLTLPTRASFVSSSLPAGDKINSLRDACNALTASQVPKDLSLKIAGLTYGGSPGTCAADPSNSGVFQDRSTVTYTATPVGVAQLDNGLAKIDYHINDKHTLSGEYFTAVYDALAPQNNAAAQPFWNTNTHAESKVAGFHWTWVPSSTVVNEARFGFNRENQLSYPGDCNKIGQPDYSYLSNMNTNTTAITGLGLPANCGFPVIMISGFSSTGCCNTFPKIQGPDKTFQIIDSVSYIRGRHSLKFGEETRHFIYNGGTYNGTRGSFSFAASGSGATGLTPLQNFLLGAPSSAPGAVSELVGNPARHITDWAYAGYVQDDWRVNNRLTLNLGLRYETVTPIKDSNNQFGGFDPTAGLVQVGKQINSLWRRPNDISPRLGFAWDITGNSKWVLRGGGSIIYVLEGFNVFVSQQGGIVPIGVNAIPTGALLNGVAGPGDISTGSVRFQPAQVKWTVAGPVLPSGTLRCDSPQSPSPNNNPCAITFVSPNLRRPYAPAWNLSLQHAFSNDLSLQVAYVGSHGTGLVGLNDLNAPPLGSGWLTASGSGATLTCAPGAGPAASVSGVCENLSRPYFSKFPYLSNIVSISNQDFSNYNGLQVTLTQRPWHGLSYLLGYTWSHSLDEAGGDWNGASLPTNLFDVRSDYGSSQDDVRHRMTLSLTYALPEKRSFAHLLEGWRLNSVTNVQTSLPWYVSDTSTNDISGVGGRTDKWNFVGNPKDFSGLGPASVPFFCGPSAASSCKDTDSTGAALSTSASSPDCVAKAAALDASNPPLYPGFTSAAALTKFGCFAQNGSVLLPAAFGTYGTSPRGLFRGRGLKLWDLSLTKDTKFTERLSGQFRFEVFNVLNKAQYTPSVTGNPSMTSAFGSSRATPDVQISNPSVGSGAARSIQLGFKLMF